MPEPHEQPIDGKIDLIRTANITAVQMERTDGKNQITLMVPDGLDWISEVVQTDEGRILYLLGKSPDIKGDVNVGGGTLQVGDIRGKVTIGSGTGGFTLQARSVSGGLNGAIADQVVTIQVPPGQLIDQQMVAPGLSSQTHRHK